MQHAAKVETLNNTEINLLSAILNTSKRNKLFLGSGPSMVQNFNKIRP